MKYLENRGILLKAKSTSQEGGFLNFLKPLMTAGLPLMNVFYYHLYYQQQCHQQMQVFERNFMD